MAKTIVILGAGLAGLPLAHYVLKSYATKFDLKVMLVSRSDQFYWNIAAPRVAIPGQLGDNDAFYSIPKAFAKYPSHQFEFVLGTAQGWDPDQNVIFLTLNNGSERKINYHTLVVATGSDYSDNMPWKALPTKESTHIAIEKMRQDVMQAKSIVVGGGGPTGIEFAGELGYEYGKAGAKNVTLVVNEPLPLGPNIMEETRQSARKELEKLKVKIIANSKVASITTDELGSKTLQILKSDGTMETIKTDLFVPTWGIKYNTSFAPASLLEEDGRLKVTKYLNSPGYKNVFAIGDAANLASYGAGVREAHVRHLATALGKYFAGDALPEFTPVDKIAMTVTVGRGRGVGQLGSWNAWSFLIWYYKGRDMCMNLVPDYVAGKRLILGSF